MIQKINFNGLKGLSSIDARGGFKQIERAYEI